MLKVNGDRPQSVLVSFIIPALNEEKHIGRCLKSIEELMRPPEVRGIEVIVVDNQSTDRTVEVSKEFGAEVVMVSPGHASRARNAGAQAAHGDWLAFIDADCELDDNWLTTCAAHVLGNSQVVAVAGAMRAPNRDATWVERTWYDLACAPPDLSVKQVRWLPTFNLLVRRDAFQHAGGFNDTLATCEDCDLGYKLVDIGKLILDPRTQAIHLGESRTLGDLFRREAWRTQGNLRLAIARPWDLSNWFSLLIPPCLLALLILSAGGAALAKATGAAVWPWFLSAAIVLGIMAAATFRKTRTRNLLSLSQQMIVLATYLAGRATGLIWPFQRLPR
jgi:glycosyltransferase involved in cell wall biosynthesis